MDQYYKPSGKFSPASLLLFILTSLILLPLLAVAYAYSIWYMPIIYLAVLMTVLFGIAVGYFTSIFVIKWGKVRNTTIAGILALLTALIALYLHWAFWLSLVQNAGMAYSAGEYGITVSNINILQVLQLVTHPDELLSMMAKINTEGTWTLKGSMVNGMFLSLIWAAEGLIVIIGSVYMACKAAKKPFSETSEIWFKEKEILVDLIEDRSGFILNLEKSQYEVLESLKKNDGKENSHTLLTLYYTDNGNFYLSAINNFANLDGKKKVTFSKDPLVEYIMIDAKHGQKLLTLA